MQDDDRLLAGTVGDQAVAAPDQVNEKVALRKQALDLGYVFHLVSRELLVQKHPVAVAAKLGRELHHSELR